jgi:peptidyl-Lys metalloendopeptidase
MVRGLFFLAGLALVACQLPVQLSGDVEALTVSLTNLNSQPVAFLVWNTPFDTHNEVFHAPIFDIQDSTGVRPVYSGIIIKRHPVITDFLTIRPGQTISTTLNLHKGYNFPEAGEYTVTLSTTMRYFEGELDKTAEEAYAILTPFTLASNTISIKVAERSPALEWGEFNFTYDRPGNPAPRANCNQGTWPSQLSTSGSNAVSACSQGINYLNNGRACSLQTYYHTWFGACDAGRYNSVNTNYGRIRSGLQASYPVDCAGPQCTANTYAYVYPADSSHLIYVCGYFWKVTTNNCVIDSQPGTLIHEMGHFNNVASLQDIRYGEANCKNLASTNPGQAIQNADNYCYFTDSCPR